MRVQTPYAMVEPPNVSDTVRNDVTAPRRPRWFVFGGNAVCIDSNALTLNNTLAMFYADCEVGNPGVVSLTIKVRAPVDGTRVEVACDDPNIDLIALAKALLAPRADLRTLVEYPAGKDGWRNLGELADRHQPLITARGGRALVDLTREPDEFLVNLIVAIAQRASPTLTFLHAGAVSIDGRGVMLCGRSGSGKSSTTATLAARGHPFFGDETLALDLGLRRIHPFGRTVKLRPGPRPASLVEALRLAPHVVRPDITGLPCTWVSPFSLFGRSALPAPETLAVVFFLRSFRAEAKAEAFTPILSDLPELQCLTQSLSAVTSWPSDAAARLIRYARVVECLRGVRCFHLDLGTPSETADLIERISHDP